MPDLLLDEYGDLDMQEGLLSLTTTRQEYQQRTGLALNLNLTEFFTHINYGLPWIKNPDISLGENLRYFLGTSFPYADNFLYTELNNYIKNFSFVKSLESSYSFDVGTRTFTYNFTIVTVEGETITFPSYLTAI